MDEGEARRWRRLRRLYFGALLAWGCAVAVYFGPNVIMFGKLTWLTPEDFVPLVERRAAPAVRAVKEFHRDRGYYPKHPDELVPDYAPTRPHLLSMGPDEIDHLAPYNHRVTYRLTPGEEGWSVSGVYASGPIPYPPVTISPTSRPTTRSTTQLTTRPTTQPKG